MSKLIDIDGTKKAMKRLADDTTTFLQEYILERDDAVMGKDEKSVAAWATQKSQVIKIIRSLPSALRIMPELLVLVEMVCTAPISDKADENKLVLHLIKTIGMKTLRNVVSSSVAGKSSYM